MRQAVALVCILGAFGCDDDGAAGDMAVAAMDAAVVVGDLAGRDLASGPTSFWYDLGACATACDPDAGSCRRCCHGDGDCSAGEKCLAAVEPDDCAGTLGVVPGGGCPPDMMPSGPICFTANTGKFAQESEVAYRCVPNEQQCATDSDCPVGEACLALGGGPLVYRCKKADSVCGNCASPYFQCTSDLDYYYCIPPYCRSDGDCMAGATCISGGCYQGVGRCVAP